MLRWQRGNELPAITFPMTRRQLFSVTGKLVGHYPLVGSLRVSCSYIKRHAAGSEWKDHVGQITEDRVREIMQRLQNSDPAGGTWSVQMKGKCLNVWCDASSVASGVVLECDGKRLEDGAWLRPKGDVDHINLAELEAVIKGVNLGLKWGSPEMRIMTDSTSVYNWLKCSIAKRFV